MALKIMDRKRGQDDAAADSADSPKRMRPDQIDGANKSNDDNRTHDDGSRCSIMDLPIEVLKEIISPFDRKNWPRLELVNRRFQSAILDAWRDLKLVRLGEFNNDVPEAVLGAREKHKRLRFLLRLLYIRSPKMESISEFFAFVPRLNAPCLEQLAKFRNLKSVDFSRCGVQVQSMAKFLNTSRSRHCLEDLRIVGSLRLPHLINFYTAGIRRQINDDILVPAFPLMKLNTFVYNCNDICNGAFLAGLDASALTTLSISGNGIPGKTVFELLRRCTQLRELCISEIICDVGGFADVLRQLALQCPNLRSLNIQGDHGSKNALVNVVSECFPNLESLNLKVTHFDADSLTELVTRLVKVKRLGLYSLTNAYLLEAVAVHLKCLTSLRLPCLMISEEEVKLLDELENLEELFVSGPAVTNQAVLYWCTSFGPRLKSLELESMVINDSSIAIIAKDLPRLRRLALNKSRITDISLRAIAAACPSLESVDLSGCVGITAAGVNAVIAGCKKLLHLTLLRAKIRRVDLNCDRRLNIRMI